MANRKVFRLIHGGTIDISPTEKVIKKADFATLLDSKALVDKVQADANQYKTEIAAEIEKEKELARKEGFAQGLQQWAAHLKELADETGRVRKDLEKMLVPIAIKAAKKIVGRETSLSEDTVADIVATTLKAVSQHRQIRIFVNPANLELLEGKREQLKNVFERLESLTIEARDDIEAGGCVIETEAGIINAEIENQWQQLEQTMIQLQKQAEEGS